MVNGIRLHVTDAPACAAHPAAVPLVLLHDLGGGAEDWAGHLPPLASARRVLAPCLRGFGLSDRPTGVLTLPTYADDLHGLLDEFELPCVHVLGLALGGAVALQAAVDRPERFASLTLVNTQASCELDEWRGAPLTLYRIGMGGPRGLNRMARLLARRCYPTAKQAPQRRRMVEQHRRNDAPSCLAALQALAGWSVEARLGDLSMPALVIASEHGLVVDPRRAEAMAHALPRARFERVADAHHRLPFDDPDRLHALLMPFLEAVDRERLLAVEDTSISGT